MNGQHIIAIDIGTTNTRAVLYRDHAGIVGQESERCATFYPKPGFVEQDPDEILAAVVRAVRRLVDNTGVDPRTVATVVFDGIWQSLLAVDAAGSAICRASTWADSRSLRHNELLRERLDAREVKRRTGCTLHPMYFLSRLAWMRDELPGVYRSADRFVSLKEYVLGRLFGSRHVDHSIASGTGVWNMHSKKWDADLLAEIGLSASRFSEPVEPTFVLPGLSRTAAGLLGLLAGTPGVIGTADGAATHLGSVSLREDRLSLTVGTGAALRRRMDAPRVDEGSEAWCYYLAEESWLLGAIVPDAGNVLAWFAANFMAAGEPDEALFARMNELAASAPAGCDGLRFLPLLGGERCPEYRPDARGAIFGLTLSHGLNHIARSLMEGLAYILYAAYRMIDPDSSTEIVATGGILKSRVLLQIVSDFFGKRLWLPEPLEAASWGSLLIARKAIGELRSLGDCERFIRTAGRQEPDPEAHRSYRSICAAYDRLRASLYGSETARDFKEAAR